MILLGERCSIYLMEDDAIPEYGQAEFGEQGGGSFYLMRSQADALIAKLRK